MTGRFRNAKGVDKNETILQIYLWLVTVIAIILLVLMGLDGLFYLSYPLVFLTVACILSKYHFHRVSIVVQPG